MNLQQIQYFKVIAELEHYTKAAEKLSISQPSLSYAMGELEKELGVPLFGRKGRNIHLTPYGIQFLEHVNRALEELENGKQVMSQMKRPDFGTINLVYATSMGLNYIPGLISSFYADGANQNIKINFEQRHTRAIAELLEKGIIDLGFGSHVDDKTVSCYAVYAEKMVMAVPRNHPLAGRKRISLEEVASEKLITFDNNCNIRKAIDSIYEKAGIRPDIAYEVSNEIMVTGIVATGLGVGIVPLIKGMDYRNVKTLEIEGCTSLRSMYMIWEKEGLLMPAAERFRDFVIRMAEKGNPFLA